MRTAGVLRLATPASTAAGSARAVPAATSAATASGAAALGWAFHSQQAGNRLFPGRNVAVVHRWFGDLFFRLVRAIAEAHAIFNRLEVGFAPVLGTVSAPPPIPATSEPPSAFARRTLFFATRSPRAHRFARRLVGFDTPLGTTEISPASFATASFAAATFAPPTFAATTVATRAFAAGPLAPRSLTPWGIAPARSATLPFRPVPFTPTLFSSAIFSSAIFTPAILTSAFLPALAARRATLVPTRRWSAGRGNVGQAFFRIVPIAAGNRRGSHVATTAVGDRCRRSPRVEVVAVVGITRNARRSLGSAGLPPAPPTATSLTLIRRPGFAPRGCTRSSLRSPQAGPANGQVEGLFVLVSRVPRRCRPLGAKRLSTRWLGPTAVWSPPVAPRAIVTRTIFPRPVFPGTLFAGSIFAGTIVPSAGLARAVVAASVPATPVVAARIRAAFLTRCPGSGCRCLGLFFVKIPDRAVARRAGGGEFFALRCRSWLFPRRLGRDRCLTLPTVATTTSAPVAIATITPATSVSVTPLPLAGRRSRRGSGFEIGRFRGAAGRGRFGRRRRCRTRLRRVPFVPIPVRQQIPIRILRRTAGRRLGLRSPGG